MGYTSFDCHFHSIKPNGTKQIETKKAKQQQQHLFVKKLKFAYISLEYNPSDQCARRWIDVMILAIVDIFSSAFFLSLIHLCAARSKNSNRALFSVKYFSFISLTFHSLLTHSQASH